jgi:hypothetical protein
MTETKVVERQRGKKFLRIELRIYQDDSRGFSDGFVITADLYEPHGTWDGRAQYRNGRERDAGGCMNDEIRVFAPELQPFIDVHLADLDGVPMHAVANGRYFYSGKARVYEESRGDTWSNRDGLTDRERGARALNIPVEDLPEGLDRSGFESFAESLRPYWAAQARTARELFDRL